MIMWRMFGAVPVAINPEPCKQPEMWFSTPSSLSTDTEQELYENCTSVSRGINFRLHDTETGDCTKTPDAAVQISARHLQVYKHTFHVFIVEITLIIAYCEV